MTPAQVQAHLTLHGWEPIWYNVRISKWMGLVRGQNLVFVYTDERAIHGVMIAKYFTVPHDDMRIPWARIPVPLLRKFLGIIETEEWI